jgi:glycine/D-amino acid oxidase-like deaminating enzyme
MGTADAIFHPEFKPTPYWWEAYDPRGKTWPDPPARVEVVVVGAGYAGLSAALELVRAGVNVAVLDAVSPGFGASTRNGGAVSGGINLGKGLSARNLSASAADPNSPAARMLAGAARSMELVEELIARESIACFYEERGRFTGAWTPPHYEQFARKVEILNRYTGAGAYMVPRAQQRAEIGSDFYYGGMILERAGKLHPSLFFSGLLDACHRHGVHISGECRVRAIKGEPGRFQLETARGPVAADHVVVTTNGYSGDLEPSLKRRIIPIASHIIATEEIDPDIAASLSPKGRTFSDSRRVISYYRLSPDGRRMIFGGRPRFTEIDPKTSARILHDHMMQRFPQLRGVRVTHQWSGLAAFTFDFLPHMGQRAGMHYCAGCNGSGVAMMTYLGQQVALKILRRANEPCPFDSELLGHPLYNGNPWFLPLVGSYYRLRDDIDRRMA